MKREIQNLMVKTQNLNAEQELTSFSLKTKETKKYKVEYVTNAYNGGLIVGLLLITEKSFEPIVIRNVKKDLPFVLSSEFFFNDNDNLDKFKTYLKCLTKEKIIKKHNDKIEDLEKSKLKIQNLINDHYNEIEKVKNANTI